MIEKEVITNQQYKFACELIWGSIPVDRTHAEESSIFKTRVSLILEQYPLLDKSFFEETKRYFKFKDRLYDILMEKDVLQEHITGKSLILIAKEQGINVEEISVEFNINLKYYK